jgi:hypothetical protein
MKDNTSRHEHKQIVVAYLLANLAWPNFVHRISRIASDFLTEQG